MTIKPAHLFLALLVIAIWGFNFVVIKVGVQEVPPLFLSALRFLFAALPAVFLVRKPKTRWQWIVSYGFALGVMQFGMLFIAMKIGMTASLASVLLQTQAFFTLSIAAIFLGERISTISLFGALVALVGLSFIGAESWAGSQALPLLLCVGAAAFWGVANVIAKASGERDLLAFTIWACLVPIAPLMLLSWLTEPHDSILSTITHPDWLTVGTVAYLAWPVTVFGFAVWNFLIERYSASRIAPFSLLVPVFGIASGVLILGEPFGRYEIAGSLLILLGLCIHVFGPRLRSRKVA